MEFDSSSMRRAVKKETNGTTIIVNHAHAYFVGIRLSCRDDTTSVAGGTVGVRAAVAVAAACDVQRRPDRIIRRPSSTPIAPAPGPPGSGRQQQQQQQPPGRSFRP